MLIRILLNKIKDYYKSVISYVLDLFTQVILLILNPYVSYMLVYQLRKALNTIFNRIHSRDLLLIYAETYHALKFSPRTVFAFGPNILKRPQLDALSASVILNITFFSFILFSNLAYFLPLDNAISLSIVLLLTHKVSRQTKISSVVCIVETCIKISKRMGSGGGGMMAIGTKLTPKEIKELKRLLFIHNDFLNKGPLDVYLLLSLTEKGCLINVKLFQHLIGIAHPKFKVQAYVLQAKCPNIKVTSRHEELDLDDIIAGVIGNKLAQEPFFFNGTLSLCTTPNWSNDSKTQTKIQSEMLSSSACKKSIIETGQPFSDYIYKNGEWSRCYDLKAGQIRPMSGHLFITSDLEKYNQISAVMFKAQAQIFNRKGFITIANYIENVKDNKELTWIQRNELLRQYSLDNKSIIPPELNPSLIFPGYPLYEYSLVGERETKFIIATSNSCTDIQNTQETLIANMDNKTIATNYVNTPSACPKMKKQLIADMIAEYTEPFFK